MRPKVSAGPAEPQTLFINVQFMCMCGMGQITYGREIGTFVFVSVCMFAYQRDKERRRGGGKETET